MNTKIKDTVFVKRVNLKELIQKTHGKIFWVHFYKKDGSPRKMIARTGVKKGVKGTGRGFKNPLEMPYVRVFDMKKREWRMINLDTITEMHFQNKIYQVMD
jgi:hypothetical protein